MRAWLKTVPTWALIGLILILAPVAGYAFNAHLAADVQQSADIRSLAKIVDQMAVVVEYNRELAEANEEKLDGAQAQLAATQLRLERLMGRIESRLDNPGQ
jgi:hypothetical protein